MNAWKDFAVERVGGEEVVTFRGARVPFAREIVLRWGPGSPPSARVVLEPRSKRNATSEERRTLALLIALMRAAGAEIDESKPSDAATSYDAKRERARRRAHLKNAPGALECRPGSNGDGLRALSRAEFVKVSAIDRCSSCDRRFRGAAKD